MSFVRCSVLPALFFFGVIASACGADDFDRESAIVALESTEATPAEANCIVDSLIALDELGAADPRTARGPDERAALVSARNRCIGQAPQTEVAGVQERGDDESELTIERAGEDENIEFEQTAIDDMLESAGSTEELRDEAINRLMTLGRSTANASCIVDHILATDELGVLVSPDFGLGLQAIEAAAFAACSTIG